jgi:hypothetical protein
MARSVLKQTTSKMSFLRAGNLLPKSEMHPQSQGKLNSAQDRASAIVREGEGDYDYDDANDTDTGNARAFWRARTSVPDGGCGMRPDDLLLARQIRKQISPVLA